MPSLDTALYLSQRDDSLRAALVRRIAGVSTKPAAEIDANLRAVEKMYGTRYDAWAVVSAAVREREAVTDTAAPLQSNLSGGKRRSHDTGEGSGADSPRGGDEGSRAVSRESAVTLPAGGDGAAVSLDSLRAGVTR